LSDSQKQLLLLLLLLLPPSILDQHWRTIGVHVDVVLDVDPILLHLKNKLLSLLP
jgi:hypothetical protein